MPCPPTRSASSLKSSRDGVLAGRTTHLWPRPWLVVNITCHTAPKKCFLYAISYCEEAQETSPHTLHRKRLARRWHRLAYIHDPASLTSTPSKILQDRVRSHDRMGHPELICMRSQPPCCVCSQQATAHPLLRTHLRHPFISRRNVSCSMHSHLLHR